MSNLPLNALLRKRYEQLRLERQYRHQQVQEMDLSYMERVQACRDRGEALPSKTFKWRGVEYTRHFDF